MNFQQLIEQSRAIRSKYADLERSKYGREWTGEEMTLGFVGDVGDLVKLVQSKEGIRDSENIDEALAHELSDCLWSIIVIADKYNIDLEKEFIKTMVALDSRLSK